MPLTGSSRLAFALCSGMMMAMCCLSLRLLRAAPAQAEQSPLTVEMTTMPAAEAIRPDTDLVRLTLTIRQHGQPLNNAYLQVKVTAPPRSAILSTDFPVVEGTHLLSLASVIRDGTLTFDYLFPIRGTYTFDLTVTPDPKRAEGLPTTLQKTLQIRENPAEVRNAWLLVSALFVFGGISGGLLARSAAARQQTALAVVLVILVAGFLRPEEVAAATLQTPQTPAAWSLEVHPTPERATVGEPVQLAIVLKKDEKIFAAPMQVAIDIHHLEDHKAVLRAQTMAPDGATSLRFQFFDGAPHAVTVTARPVDDMTFAADVPSPRAVLDMEVTAVHPPVGVQLRLMAILIGVLAVGIMAGGFLMSTAKERRRA
jgi:hypothetical protein